MIQECKARLRSLTQRLIGQLPVPSLAAPLDSPVAQE
jgi:hypothetical protein